jgi:hypothetical protein
MISHTEKSGLEESENPLPEEIMNYYNLRLLGKPFHEVNEKGKIVYGYYYEGKKYYEK